MVVKVGLALLNELRPRRRVWSDPPEEKKKGGRRRGEGEQSGQEVRLEVQGPLEIWYFYHLGVTVTVGVGVGSWGRQGEGQRAGVCGDVVFVVVVRLGGPLRVTAGQEVGARPGHSGFLFGAGAAHLLPGNHSNKKKTLCIGVHV